MPRLLEDYVATRQLNIEYRDLTFENEEATRAAEAAACAMDQDGFWPYHELLFDHQRQTDQESFSRQQVDELAEMLGLDMERFNSCMDNGRYADEIAQMQEEAERLGIESTPTLIINDEIVPYDSYEQVQAVIESELDR